jgi:hypothetical protein
VINRLGELVSSVVAGEREARDEYLEGAARGAHFLLISTPTAEQVLRAKAILAGHDAWGMRHYGDAVVTDLPSAGQDRRDKTRKDQTVNARRPIGVVVLAILAGLAALLAAYHALQYLGLLPLALGPLRFYGFDLFGAILWGVTAAVWVWAAVNLWRLNPQALLFVILLAAWNFAMALLSWLGQSDFQAVLPALLLNGVILLYAFSQRTTRAFRGV